METKPYHQKKNTFKKLLSKSFALCWWCGEPTHFTCTERDGSEIWCCLNCLWEKEKIKNFNPKTRKYSAFQKKCKKQLSLCVKKTKDGVIWDGDEVGE